MEKDFLSPTTKKTLITIGVIVAGVIAYKIYKTYTKDAPNRQETKAGANELEALNKNPKTRQKITKQQAMAFANTLFTAMDGYGTEEWQIMGVFYKIYNDADFLALSNAYGTREISSGSWNPEPNYKGTMTGALHNELDTTWTKKINDLLKTKKITYRI